MQRYRLNTRFLIILLVLFVAVLGGGYGLWAYQIYKSAPGIKAEAVKARELAREAEQPGERILLYRQANELWRRYLNLREDDIDANVQYAETLLEFAESGTANSDELLAALTEAERILRIHPIPQDSSEWSEEMAAAVPKLDALREKTAAARIRFGLWSAAIDHLDHLIDVRKSGNPEHEVMRLRALIGSQRYDDAITKGFELVGYDQYDEFEDEFNESRATAPHQTQAYVLLAQALRHEKKADELADSVMNQLVAVNPDSHEAFLERCLYWQDRERLDLARQDWERAYALNSEDLDILLAGARLALRMEDTGLALELAQSAMKLHPQDHQPYIEVARAQTVNGNRDTAIETIDTGMKTIQSGFPALQLLFFKCNLLLDEGKLEEAREAIALLSKAWPGGDLPRYYEGRILLAERKWVDAIKAFEEARPGLTRPEMRAMSPAILPSLDRFRGIAYNAIGERDRALNAFRQSLQADPDQARVAQLISELDSAQGGTPAPEGDDLATQVEAMKRRPPAQQQWQQIEDFVRTQIESHDLDPASANLYWAQYHFYRDQTEQSYQLLQEALDLDPPQRVVIGAARLALALPQAGPEVAEQLLDQAAERFGDNATQRLERGRIWIVEKEDGLVDKLWSLEEGSEQWDDHQRTHFLKRLADYFRQIGQPGEADRALEMAAEVSPQDLDALMEMFMLARSQRDNDGMREVQQRIEQVVGSRDDSRWQYTEAARLITLYAAGMRDPQLLEQAANLTDNIAQQRPEWHELFRLRGDIFALQGQVPDAIAAYDRALELGPPTPLAVRQHVQLLVGQQRYLDARRVAQRLPEAMRLSVLGALYAEVMLQSSDSPKELEEAFQLAAQVVEEDPDNRTIQLWYADQLVRHGRVAEAEAPVRKALEINPQDVQTWVTLVRYLAHAKRSEDAEQALREARLILPEHEIPLLLAQGYALLGKWLQAEREFLMAHRADPDDLKRVRMLADFYLGPFYNPERKDRYAKAAPYINMLLEQGRKDATSAESVQWARRKAAEILASTGDYQNTLKAEKLLAANEVDGQMPAEDKLQLAKMLSARPEPTSRRKAIRLVEEVRSQQALGKDAALLLAQLYWKVDRQDEARQQIFDVVAHYGDDPRVWQTFVAMLLARGNYDDAARYFRERLEPTLPSPLTLANLDRDAMRTLTLGVQIWSKQGESDKALARLYGMIPRNPDEIREQDVAKLLEIGGMLVLIGEKERAAPVYQLFAKKRPQQGLVYVKFLGAYQDAEKAFGFLKQIEANTEPRDMFPIVQTALSIVNARRDEIGDEKDALIEQWLQKGLRENPDSTNLLGLKADLLEMQEKYSEAQAVYERMLAAPGFTGLLRTRVLNNLAFLLALQKIDTDRALELIAEAEAIRGPSDDILDTRAAVYMARGNYNAAVNDLELAVTEDPDAAKWYHLARAYWLAGRRQDAMTAWNRATDLDIGPEKLNRMEHEALQEFREEIEQEQSRQGVARG